MCVSPAFEALSAVAGEVVEFASKAQFAAGLSPRRSSGWVCLLCAAGTMS